MKQINKLQEAREVIKNSLVQSDEERYYEIYLTSRIYVRITFKKIMAVLFCSATILCALQSLFSNDEKDSIDITKNQKADKLTKALALSGFSRRSQKARKYQWFLFLNK